MEHDNWQPWDLHGSVIALRVRCGSMASPALTQGRCQQERHYPVELYRTFLVIGKGSNALTLHEVLPIGKLDVHESRRAMTHCAHDTAIFVDRCCQAGKRRVIREVPHRSVPANKEDRGIVSDGDLIGGRCIVDHTGT